MAIEYVGPKVDKSVLMAYRLDDGQAVQTFKLKGLMPWSEYRVTTEGKDIGTMTGRALMEQGLVVKLETPWSASVTELQASDRQ
jgi:hypothetical protein